MTLQITIKKFETCNTCEVPISRASLKIEKESHIIPNVPRDGKLPPPT